MIRVRVLADPNNVAFLQQCRLGHVRLVDLSSVPTAKVFDVVATVRLHDLSVLATDRAIFEDNGAAWVPTENNSVVFQRDHLARVFSR